MAERLDFAGAALAGQTLGLALLTALWRKGVLSDAEVRDLADQALLDLEKWQALFPANQDSFEEARRLFDAYVRSLPSGDDAPPGSRR